MVVQSVACQVTSLKIKYNPFAKAFQDNKDRFAVCVCVTRLCSRPASIRPHRAHVVHGRDAGYCCRCSEVCAVPKRLNRSTWRVACGLAKAPCSRLHGARRSADFATFSSDFIWR